MRIDFVNEILFCFERQYPKRFEYYNDVFYFENKVLSKKRLLELTRLYEDFVLTFDFLVSLIIKLEKEVLNK